MTIKISGSVGKGGKNDTVDVEIVQTLLNKHARNGGYPSVKVNAKFDDKIVKAILAFQKAFIPKIKPDGLVEKGKNTFKALNRKPQDLLNELAGQTQVYTVQLDKKVYSFKSENEASSFVASLKQVDIGGKKAILTPKQFDTYLKECLKLIKSGPVLDLRLRAQSANTIWDHFAMLNREELFASWCVQLWGPKLPPVNLVSKAMSGMFAIDGAVKSNNPKKVIDAIVKNEPIINKAFETMHKYRKDVISRGDGWISSLKFTKTASFTIVAALAAPQLVVAGATAGQAAFLVGVGTSALPSLGNEVGKSIAGTSQGALDALYNIGIDSAIGGTVGLLLKGQKGTEILESVEKKILKNVASNGWFKRISNRTIQKWLAGFMKTTGKAGIEESVKTAGSRVGKSLKGESYTKKKFFEDVTGTFTATLTAGFLNPFDKAIENDFAPNLYKSIMKSNMKVDILKGGKKVKVPISEMFGGLPKDKAIKSITDVIKGTGGNVTGKILDWGMGKFKGTDPKKLVEQTATEALKSPAWKEMQKLLLEKVKK